MALQIPGKRHFWMACTVLLPLLTLLLLVSGLFQWSPLNCWHEDIDIKTGRIQHTRYLLFCQIGKRTEETWLSQSVPDRLKTAPDWHRVHTFSPGVAHSRHYRFHNAINQIKTLEMLSNHVTYDLAAKQAIANKVLELWNSSDSDREAEDFVNQVWANSVAIAKNGQQRFSMENIPDA